MTVQEEQTLLDDAAEKARQKQIKREKIRARSQRRLKIIFPFLLILVFLSYAFTTNFIPSASMKPNLNPGDHILTMRAWLAYFGGRMPARGDIIVFALPKAQEQAVGMSDSQSETDTEPAGRQPIGVFRLPPGDILIKRVVGLPGESLLFKDGVLHINGKPFSPSYPTLPGDPDFESEYNYAVEHPLKLGPDELFVLGDNGDNSEDGRFWGPLKRKDVI